MIERFTPRVRARFNRMLNELLKEFTVPRLASMIERGGIEAVFEAVERHAKNFSNLTVSLTTIAGEQTAAGVISDVLKVVVDFNQVNARAVQAMQNAQLQFVRNFTAEQRAASRLAMTQGIQEGLNPRGMATRFRGSLGLTEYQQGIVERYRQQLQAGNRAALTRQLRDRRFDRTVSRTFRDGRQLTEEQIDRMSDRYRQRWIKHRAETIARTESLRAVHQGNDLAFAQVIEDGMVQPDEVIREWIATGGTRTRDSHRAMDGQQRKVNEPFVSGNGYRLKYPGDIDAPASETINCRCVVGTRIVPRKE